MPPSSNLRVAGGAARGRRLAGPAVPGVRPTAARVRAAIFNILPPETYRDARVLDLFAGTGSLGIEALSRGAAWADFVERHRRQSQVLRDNLATAGYSGQAAVHGIDAQRALSTLAGPYQLIMLDPPYRMAGLGKFMESLAAAPGLAADGGRLVVGHSRHLTLAEQYGPLRLESQRRYGDNLVDFYQWGGRE